MLPYFFHPTRVVIVTNSNTLLNLDYRKFSNVHMTYIFFDNLDKALNFINDSHHHSLQVVDNKVTPYNQAENSVFNFHKKIYSPQRFEEISTILVDEIFLDQDIESFFEKINFPCIQKIILQKENSEKRFSIKDYTHENDYNTFIVGHNVEKQLSYFLQSCQWTYFIESSKDYVNSKKLSNKDNNFLDSCYLRIDPDFKVFFRAILSTYKFTEAYCYENCKNYLFLDSQAQDHGLVINVADQLDIWATTGEEEGIDTPLLNDLKNRKKMMCYIAGEGALQPYKNHWGVYAHPAKTFQGQKDKFYYALAPNIYDIDPDGILPFRDYKINRFSTNCIL